MDQTHLPSHSSAPRFVSFLQLYQDRSPQDRARAARLVELFDIGGIVLSIGSVEALVKSEIEPATAAETRSVISRAIEHVLVEAGNPEVEADAMVAKRATAARRPPALTEPGSCRASRP